MRDRQHPAPDLLLRFLRGEAAQGETRAILRHLLGGCPRCTAVTRPVWIMVDRPCFSPANDAPEPPDELEIVLYRARLHAEVEYLRASRRRLHALLDEIRQSALETSDEDIDADPDAATQMRAVIANGLRDCLDPLIRDLRQAARYQPVRRGRD